MSSIASYLPQLPSPSFDTALMASVGFAAGGPLGGIIGYTVAALTESYGNSINKFMNGLVDDSSMTLNVETASVQSQESPLEKYNQGLEPVIISQNSDKTFSIKIPASKAGGLQCDLQQEIQEKLHGFINLTYKSATDLFRLLNQVTIKGGLFLIFTYNTLHANALPISDSHLAIREADFNGSNVTNGTMNPAQEERSNYSALAAVGGGILVIATVIVMFLDPKALCCREQRTSAHAPNNSGNSESGVTTRQTVQQETAVKTNSKAVEHQPAQSVGVTAGQTVQQETAIETSNAEVEHQAASSVMLKLELTALDSADGQHTSKVENDENFILRDKEATHESVNQHVTVSSSDDTASKADDTELDSTNPD